MSWLFGGSKTKRKSSAVEVTEPTDNLSDIFLYPPPDTAIHNLPQSTYPYGQSVTYPRLSVPESPAKDVSMGEDVAKSVTRQIQIYNPLDSIPFRLAPFIEKVHYEDSYDLSSTRNCIKNISRNVPDYNFNLERSVLKESNSVCNGFSL